MYARERCVNMGMLGSVSAPVDPEIDLLLGTAALALLGSGMDSAGLAAALSGDGVSVSEARAARVLDRLGQLGLARVVRQQGQRPAFVATSRIVAARMPT